MATPQQPINSGFGAHTTASEVVQGIDLTGKIVISSWHKVGLDIFGVGEQSLKPIY